MGSYYAAKVTTRRGYFAALGKPVPDGQDPDQQYRIFLLRIQPLVSTEVVHGDGPPRLVALQFDSRAAAFDAARLIGGPGRRVGVRVEAA